MAPRRFTAQRLGPLGMSESTEWVAQEAPLIVSARGIPVVTLLRTPGHDLELTAGLLVAEGLVPLGAALPSIVQLGDDLVDIDLPAECFAKRNLMSTSSCGACSKEMIQDILLHAPGKPLTKMPASWAAAELVYLPELLRAQQSMFSATGGTHAAGLLTTNKTLAVVHEDVGRHNAVDKAIGWLAMQPTPGPNISAMVLSGRIAFELISKAYAAMIPVVVAVSAPTSLAIELADKCGITLCAFTRNGHVTVYTHAHRIA